MTRSISWLVCTSSNPQWLKLQNKNSRTKRLLGSWSGDQVEIIGDYAEEEFSHFVRREYVDISYEIVATIFDLDSSYLEAAIEQLQSWPSFLEKLGMLMLLKEPPEKLGHALKTVYPDGWEREFDTLCKSNHRDPRDNLPNAE